MSDSPLFHNLDRHVVEQFESATRLRLGDEEHWALADYDKSLNYFRQIAIQSDYRRHSLLPPSSCYVSTDRLGRQG